MQFHRNRLTGVWLVEVDGNWYAFMPTADPDSGDLYCELEPWSHPGNHLEPTPLSQLWDETGWTPTRTHDGIAHLGSMSRA